MVILCSYFVKLVICINDKCMWSYNEQVWGEWFTQDPMDWFRQANMPDLQHHLGFFRTKWISMVLLAEQDFTESNVMQFIFSRLSHTEKNIISGQGKGRGECRKKWWDKFKLEGRRREWIEVWRREAVKCRPNNVKTVGSMLVYSRWDTWTAVRPVFLCPLTTPTGNTWAVKKEPEDRYFKLNSKWWDSRKRPERSMLQNRYTDKAAMNSTDAFTRQNTKLAPLNFKAFPVSMSLIKHIKGTNCYFPWEVVAVPYQCIYFT